MVPIVLHPVAIRIGTHEGKGFGKIMIIYGYG